MAITVINVSSPNDNHGDTLRNANIICNNNFSYLDTRVSHIESGLNLGQYTIKERSYDGIVNLLKIQNYKSGNPYSILEIWSNDEAPLESTMALFLQPTGVSSSYMFTDFSCMNYDGDQRTAIVMQSRDMPLYPLRIAFDDGTGAYNQYHFNYDGAFKLLKNPVNNNMQRIELGAYGSIQDYVRDNDTGFASTRATSIQFNNFLDNQTTMHSTAYNAFAPAMKMEINGDGNFLFRYADSGSFTGGTGIPSDAFYNIGVINPNFTVAPAFKRFDENPGYLMGDGSIDSKIYYNVLDYGVIGNGVVDDTSAFNAVISLANSNNGVVFIPANTNISVNNSILLPSNISIKGGHKFTSKITLASSGSTTAKVLRNNDFALGNDNIDLSNFTIDGGNLENTVALELQQCSYVTINNMHITKGGIEGVYLYLCNFIIVNDLITHNNSTYQVDASGIHFDTCTNFQLNGCVSFENGFHGVICTGSVNGYIQATVKDNGFNGIFCQVGCEDIVIDCNSTNNFRGVYIQDSTKIRVTGTVKSNVNGCLTNGSTKITFSVTSSENEENDLYLVGISDEVNWCDGFPIRPVYTKDYTESILYFDGFPVGTSSQFLKANGSLDSTAYQPLLGITTIGNDLITYAGVGQPMIPIATNSNFGLWLSYADFKSAAGIQSTITNPVVGIGTGSVIPKWNSISGLTDSAISDDSSTINVANRNIVTTVNSNVNYLNVIGGGDGNAYSSLSLSDTSNQSIWQFTNFVDKSFGFSHNDGTSWTFPVFVKNNGNVVLNSFGDSGEKLQVNGTGKVTGALNVGSVVKAGGTSTQSLMADGGVLELTSSSYSPTFSNLSNVSSVTNTRTVYTKVGNIVNVTISGDWTATTTGVLYFESTIPFNTGSNIYLVGTGSSPIGTSDVLEPLSVTKISTTKVAIRGTRSAASTQFSFSVSFQYDITF